jgi:tetratricopeptide (TPR) repeat protein
MILNGSCEEMVAEALMLERQGRTEEAIAAYEHLLGHWPGLPNCWFNLAVLQRQTGRFSRALASYQEALERGVAQPEEVHLNRGVIYSDGLNQYDAAEREIKKALQLNPSYVPALINYANLHEDLGRRELAAGVYERVLALTPEAPQMLARYAGLKTFIDPEDPMIVRLRKALQQDKISAADRASMEFALGRALDATGAYDAAFETYRAANRHSRESAPDVSYYDLAAEEAYTQKLMDAFPARSTAQHAPAADRRQEIGPEPVFICGMFRSGSTLLEQLLAGHPRVGAGGELDFLPRAVQTVLAPFPESLASRSALQLRQLAQDYRRMLGELLPNADYATDKRPDNYLYIGLIKTLFPNAKIVHTRRNALDNCLSIYFLHLDQRMSYALDLMDIGHRYRQYLLLMAHWKKLFGEDILEVSYDTLVREPKPQMEQLLAFLGLNWDERCLSVAPSGRAVKTASVWQVREPLYQRSSGRASSYARQLAELRKYLEYPL